METAFTMSNKNYYACKVCDAVVHNSLDCPNCEDCQECEGNGRIEVDPLSDHKDYDCFYCDGTGKKESENE